MKKLIVLSLFVLGLTLTGCTDGYVSSSELEDLNVTLSTRVGELDTAVSELITEKEAQDATILELSQENEALQEALDLQYAKLKNVYARDLWASRKVNYDPVTYAPVEAEYCFGVYDDDWSTITANDYTQGAGLHFVVTVLEVQWGTEVLLQDSCGNFSELLLTNSSYGMYSMPTGLLEVGKTYDVVLYKDVYFTIPQLGFLPLTEMGDWGAYPEDISGITLSEITE